MGNVLALSQFQIHCPWDGANNQSLVMGCWEDGDVAHVVLTLTLLRKKYLNNSQLLRLFLHPRQSRRGQSRPQPSGHGLALRAPLPALSQACLPPGLGGSPHSLWAAAGIKGGGDTSHNSIPGSILSEPLVSLSFLSKGHL